ncbi:MAG TPA: nucleotidyltransferase domain-containing protein [Phycisphaerae bacterium]|nr:nucleotidyltransferase domain-containing protein [Phycisphaerae bacterium]
MREALWNAIRAARYEEASHALKTLHAAGECFDGHLVLAALMLQHEGGQAIPDEWANEWHAAGLAEFVSIARHHFSSEWRAAVDQYETVKGSFDEGAVCKEAGALAAWCAIRSATELGDRALAANIVTTALDHGYRNPAVLTEALRVELEHPFLPCPDTLAVDLRLWVDDKHKCFMSPVWPVVANAIVAWLNHRDGAAANVQEYLTTKGKELLQHPYDVAESLPFLAGIQKAVGNQYAAQALPRSKNIYYICRYILYGSPSWAEANGLLDDMLRQVPSSPQLHLCKARIACDNKRYTEALESATCVTDLDSTNLSALRIGVQTAARSGAIEQALKLSKQLVQLSFDHLAAYEFVYREFASIGRQDDIVAVAEYWCGKEWDTKENARLPLDLSAITQFGKKGRDEALVALLNRRAEQLGEEQLASLLAREEVRSVLAKLGELQGLSVVGRLAWARACDSINDVAGAAAALEALALDTDIAPDDSAKATHRKQLLQARALLQDDMESAERLEDFLRACARAEPDTVIESARRLLQRLGHQGHLLGSRRVIQALAARTDSDKIVAFCANWLDAGLHDAAAGSELLKNRVEDLNSVTAWRSWCVLLDRTGETEAWRHAATAGQERFPESSALFLIEEGLAEAASEPARAVALLHRGLLSHPTDSRGLNRFLALAKRFDRHNDAIEVLHRTIAEAPTSTPCRVWLVAMLDALGTDERLVLQHLYHLVYRDPRYEKKDREKSRTQIPHIRGRLLAARQAEADHISTFAGAHRHGVSEAIRSVPLLSDGVVAAVFAQLNTQSTNASIAKKTPKQSTPAEMELGLLLIVDSQQHTTAEQRNLAKVAAQALAAHGFSQPIEMHGSADIWHSLRRSNRDLLDRLLAGVPSLDSPFLECLRALESHRETVLERFEQYVACYVAAGSFVRGVARPSSDIDVWIVIDDTDVKRMGRVKLHEQIKEIVDKQAVEAQQRCASNRRIHVQTYLLSDFWSGLRESSPILISFLRDGVPLHDNGFFNTWPVLLDEGKLQATKEAMDRQMKALRVASEKGRKLLNGALAELVQIIKHTAIGPLEVVLEALRLPTGDYRQVVELAKDEVVAQRQLLTTEDLQIAEEAIDMFKAYEAGTLPEALKAITLFRRAEELADKCQRVYETALFERDLALLRSWADRIRQLIQGAAPAEDDAPPSDEGVILKAFVQRVDELLAHTDGPLAPLRTAMLTSELVSIERRGAVPAHACGAVTGEVTSGNHEDAERR